MASDAAITEFISFTGGTADQARSYLEMAGGDLQQAVGLFMEMGADGAGGAAPAGAAGAAGAPGAAGADEDEVRAPIAAFDDQMINADAEQRRMQDAIRRDADAMDRRMAFDRDEDSVGGKWRCLNCGNENFAKRKACFKCGTARGSGEAGGQKAINQLFKAPEYNESAPFFQTIEKARADGKWVLVNIQQADAFASHALNRDVWGDETVQELVVENFVFWQRDNKSTEGEQFCKTYKCSGDLPHICMVDPRTGRSVKGWKGSRWTTCMAATEALFEFMEGNPAPASGSPAAAAPASAAGAAPASSPAGASPAAAAGSAAAPAAATPTLGPGNVLGGGAPGGAPAAAADAGAAPAPAADAEEAEEGAVAAMPEEPGADVEHVKVSFRLPSGQRQMRRFRPADTLEVLFAVASALAGKPPDTLDVSTQMPKRSLRDVEGGMAATVKDAKVAGNMLLIETGKRRKTE